MHIPNRRLQFQTTVSHYRELGLSEKMADFRSAARIEQDKPRTTFCVSKQGRLMGVMSKGFRTQPE